MNLSPSAQATLLMTSHFGKTSTDGPRPLSIVEWGRFAMWLKDQAATPEDLLRPNVDELLQRWQDKKVDAARITQLLSRGHALALAVEKWQRAGLWIITRADPDYPMRLKSRLKTLSPPVLFGCGERRLINDGGLAVIGSRNASDEDLAFTQTIGSKAAQRGISIVSGGARGVDETAMLGAINADGGAIGIVADSLLRAATSKKWRNALMDGRLVLLSPFYPEAGFSVGNAMARNKYIYCLAESSLVIHSGTKGGTINGAEENLKKNWVPLWVKPTHDKEAGNASLVAKGGRWCESDTKAIEVQSLFVSRNTPDIQEQETQTDMFALNSTITEPLKGSVEPSLDHRSLPRTNPKTVRLDDEPTQCEAATVGSVPIDFYQAFVLEITRVARKPVTTDEIVEGLVLHKTQVNTWLKRACDEGLVKKLKGPVRYQFVGEK
ncbi:MAG: DNA-processing protein DprA [Hyphomicrobiales bacterium]